VVANLKSDWLPGRGYKLLESLEDVETAAAEEEHLTDADPAEQEQPEPDPGEAEQHAGLDMDETDEPTREK
jgi:hypothetical protein